jgi:hypothetical protein
LSERRDRRWPPTDPQEGSVAKHVDELGTIENWTAPWETATGETEIDKPKLRKYLWNLLTDKARAQDARDEATEKISAAEAERDKAKAEAAEKDPDSAGKIAKLEKENTDLKSKLSDRERADLAEEVAADKGLTKAQSRYLTGTTQDELEKSADQFIKDNGIVVGDPEDDDDPNGEQNDPLRRTPRSTTNPGDPNPSSPKELSAEDIEKAIAGFESNPFR